jgi:filamentous hemagglutinin family protein
MSRSRLKAWILANSVVSTLLYVQSIAAQVIPDATLPAGERSQVTGNPNVQINGGAVRGSNLFHSFSQFSIPTGGSAFFNNAPTIANIFARITGSSASNIDGLMRANGTANLFLLNPNGILFGPNASLNIGGSFLGTTANAIGFSNGEKFSSDATQPLPSQVLVVNPNALFFNQLAAKSVINRSTANNGTGLQVSAGQSLLLVGSDVRLEGGQIVSPGSRVELGAVAGQGMVELRETADDWRLSFPDNVARADIALSNSALIDVRAGGGGSIAATARNLSLSEGSRLHAGIDEGFGFVGAQAGDIQLNATDAINLAEGNRIRNDVELGGTGNAGNINITTGSLAMVGSAQVTSVTNGQGNGGNLNINARDTVSWKGLTEDPDASGTIVGLTGVGNAGNVNITTGSLFVTEGAQLLSQTRGEGNAGSVDINARDTVSLVGSTLMNRSANGSDRTDLLRLMGVGNVGNINITTGSLFINRGVGLVSITMAEGDAGSVNINARDMFSINDSIVLNLAASSDVRKAAEINITAGSLLFTNGGRLITITAGGRAGKVDIKVRDAISIDGKSNGVVSSGILANVVSGGVGPGGDLSITAGSLSLTNGGALSAITTGRGNAGNINVTVRDAVLLDGRTDEGTGIFTTVDPLGVGNGGTINLRARSLSILGDATLAADTNGQGQGGNINLDVKDTLLLSGGKTTPTGESSRITLGVLPQGRAAGGDLHIKAGSLVLQDGGLIKVSTQGQGDAGNIAIRADKVDISGSVPTSGLPSGLFTSSNTVGNAGDITLHTQTFRIADGAALSARSRGDGQGGNISVTAARSFEAVNSGQLITTTFGRGQAGKITVNAGEQVTISGSDLNYAARLAKFPDPVAPSVANAISETGPASGFFANTERNSVGRGGDIQIVTGQLTVQEGAQLITSTSGSGRAGDITVNASNIQLSGVNSGLFAQTTTTADAGNLTIQPRGDEQSVQVNLQGGAQISASTSGSGRGGDLTITAPESITLTGNGSVVAAGTGSSGAGGNLNLITGTLTIQNRAEVTVSSTGTGLAGSLFIDADRILLNNQGSIRADTSGGGGNIKLRSPFILLRNGSNITTNARGANIPGGNISIDTRFLVGVLKENSNISANSEDFRGGNVRINAFSIYGIRTSPVSTLLSDITATGATSTLNGTIDVVTAGLDPTAGLVALPVDLADPGLIAQGCPANQGSSFVITGRGGLPPTPEQQLDDDAEWSDRRRLAVTQQTSDGRGVRSQESEVRINSKLSSVAAQNATQNSELKSSPDTPHPTPHTSIIEATGWQITSTREIFLVANTPNPAVQNRPNQAITCQGR